MIRMSSDDIVPEGMAIRIAAAVVAVVSTIPITLVATAVAVKAKTIGTTQSLW